MLLQDFLPGADSELQKLHLVYLHGKQFTESLKLKTRFSSAGQKAAKMKMQQSTYDQFFLFGDHFQQSSRSFHEWRDRVVWLRVTRPKSLPDVW